MLKWSEMLAKLIPWFDTDDVEETRRVRDESAASLAAQEFLVPLIDAQTAYLVNKGEVNGFTRQLRLGFERRATGE